MIAPHLWMLAVTAHPSPTPSACASRCNKTNMKPAFAADAAHRRSEHDPGTHAEAFRSGVQRMDSATATSVIWVGHVSPSLEFGAERPVRRHVTLGDRATSRKHPSRPH